MTKKISKKRNPQDLTLRNLRALKKKFNVLGLALLDLDKRVKWLENNWLVSKVTGSRLREITTTKINKRK